MIHPKRKRERERERERETGDVTHTLHTPTYIHIHIHTQARETYRSPNIRHGHRTGLWKNLHKVSMIENEEMR
jgi:hypothetical protein